MRQTRSPYLRISSSRIHTRGAFAARDIKTETRIIEYVGEKITKAESERRAERVLDASRKHPQKGAVYLFTLNQRHDIDGNVPYNTARLINHSCNPNCEAVIDRGHIWIEATRNIKKGEELTYDYGYDLDDYAEHPCRCGAKNCIGYIVARDQRWKLRMLLLVRAVWRFFGFRA